MDKENQVDVIMLEVLQEICGDIWLLDDIPPDELTYDRLYKMLKNIGMYTEKTIDKVTKIQNKGKINA